MGRTTVGAAYAQINYKLGDEFEELGVNGTAQIYSVFGNYPLVRSRSTNLYAQFGFDHRANEDKIDLANLSNQKRTNVLMPGIYGDHRDQIGGGGITSYGLTLFLGDLDIQTPTTKNIDQSTAKTNGQYAKLAFNATRLQKITDTLSFYAAINGQISSKNLDIWEKMELGGLYGVRAYPGGTAVGDQGYILNLEARLLMPPIAKALPGNLYLLALFDTGTVQRNKNPWAGGDNTVTLSGAGVGVMWSAPNNFAIKTYYARKIGKTPNIINTSAAGQFWFQLIKYF
jgi:hemolysin activation/secretion protein